jgi:hypothetical protein
VEYRESAEGGGLEQDNEEDFWNRRHYRLIVVIVVASPRYALASLCDGEPGRDFGNAVAFGMTMLADSGGRSSAKVIAATSIETMS